VIVVRYAGYLVGATLASIILGIALAVLGIIFVLDQTVGRLTIFGHSVSAHVFHPLLDAIIDGLCWVMERATNR
jgi:hypothetical protein